MTRKQNSTIGSTIDKPDTNPHRHCARDGVVPHPIVAGRIVAVRIGASSKWLRGDPPCEPKAREINELPVRFDPERAPVRCRAEMHASEPGNQRASSIPPKKLLPWCLNNSDPHSFC